MSKLTKMLEYVAENNPFYQNIIKEYHITDPTDITQYPILTREQLQNNRFNMFSNGYKAMYFSQQLRRQSSSGSSGIPINVYWDYKDWHISNLALWRRRVAWYGIYPKDKCVIFTLNAFNTQATDHEVFYYISQNILSVNITLIHNEEQYLKLIKIINDFNPSWLYIQPFILSKITYYYKKNNLSKPTMLKYIEAVGELLSTDLRRRAYSFFGVPVVSMYGSEEMNGIAIETPYKDMQIIEDNVLVEVLANGSIKQDGQGTAVVTNLNNRAMPLIRYLQGDSIALGECNDGKQKIEIINGRTIDSVVIDGYELHAYVLLEIIAQINNELGDVILESKYKFINSKNELICYIIIDEKYKLWENNIKKLYYYLVNKRINQTKSIKFTLVFTNIIDNNLRKRRILNIEE